MINKEKLERIRHLITANPFTIKELAEKSGVSEPTAKKFAIKLGATSVNRGLWSVDPSKKEKPRTNAPKEESPEMNTHTNSP